MWSDGPHAQKADPPPPAIRALIERMAWLEEQLRKKAKKRKARRRKR